jgi:hypothetical protein
MIAPLALAIGATAPVLPAGAYLEVFATFARTAVAERLPRAPESPAPCTPRGQSNRNLIHVKDRTRQFSINAIVHSHGR